MDDDVPERVLFMFEPESVIRRFFIWIGNQFLFDTIVFAAIIASCVFLMITPPYEDMIDYSHDVNTSTVKPPIPLETMDMWNSVITIIFTIELMVRCMSQVISSAPMLPSCAFPISRLLPSCAFPLSRLLPSCAFPLSRLLPSCAFPLSRS
jgi:hypothetical protein